MGNRLTCKKHFSRQFKCNCTCSLARNLFAEFKKEKKKHHRQRHDRILRLFLRPEYLSIFSTFLGDFLTILRNKPGEQEKHGRTRPDLVVSNFDLEVLSCVATLPIERGFRASRSKYENKWKILVSLTLVEMTDNE